MNPTILLDPKDSDFPVQFKYTPVEQLEKAEILKDRLPIVKSACICFQIYLLSELQEIYILSEKDEKIPFQCSVCRNNWKKELFYPLLSTTQKIYLWFCKKNYENLKNILKIVGGLILFIFSLCLKKIIDPFDDFYLNLTNSLFVFSLGIAADGIFKILSLEPLYLVGKTLIVSALIMVIWYLVKEIFLL